MAAVPGFKSQHQCSSAAPFLTPPMVGYTCQHSCIFPAFLGFLSKSWQAWPCGVEPIISKLLCRLCNQGELPPSYILSGSHSHLPGSKHGHSYLTYLQKQLKVIDMLNDHSRGYLQNCCYAKQLSMALLHVSYLPVQACGGEDILYVYIFLIFPGHPEFWTPLQIPIWGGPWLHSVSCPQTWFIIHEYILFNYNYKLLKLKINWGLYWFEGQQTNEALQVNK